MKKNIKDKILHDIENILIENTERIQEEFSSALYAGDNDVVVRYEMNENEAKIIASGSSVLFIEYGTGVAYPEHPTGKYKHGTYGKGLGANPKGWYYYGSAGNLGEVPANPELAKKGLIHTKGNPPAAIMYNAEKRIREQIRKCKLF